MSSFYFIYLKGKPDISESEIEEKMNKALDWYRLDDATWIVYSSASAEKLYARLSPLVKKGGNVFICELNTEIRQGWMAKAFWEWLNKDR